MFYVQTDGEEKYQAKKILIATGGSMNPQAYKWIGELGHTILNPIPSLFTFNDQGEEI